MDVGVGESGEDAATLEVDAVGAREGGLVRADAAGHDLARDREGARLRQRGVERADRPVLEDHACNPIGPGRRMGRGVRLADLDPVEHFGRVGLRRVGTELDERLYQPGRDP